MILANLNLCVTSIPPTKFQLNLTYDSGEDVDKCEKLTMDDGRTTD